MKLEDIGKGQVLAGVQPGKLVTVVAAEMRGADALELVFKVNGTIGQQRLDRSAEDSLVLVKSQTLGAQPAVWVLIVLALLAGGFGAYRFWPKPVPPPEPVVSNDIPVVIRTNGGMLEVAKVKHRRTFNLSQTLSVLEVKVPFCKAAASYTVDTHITYRVRLAKDWQAQYRNQRLELTVPKLEPAIPVALDTSGVSATVRKCPLVPPGIQDDLLKTVSTTIDKDAWNPRYLNLARNEGARDTVREFARKWLITQKGYEIPLDVPIDVKFEGE